MVFKNHILFYQVSVNVLIIKTNPHYLQGFERISRRDRDSNPGNAYALTD